MNRQFADRQIGPKIATDDIMGGQRFNFAAKFPQYVISPKIQNLGRAGRCTK